jgi:hypothetical protein
MHQGNRVNAPDFHTPDTLTHWCFALSVLFIGLFKVSRGRTLQQQSSFFDALGISTIAFDYVVGTAYLFAGIGAFFPAIYTEHVRLTLVILATPVAAWAWYCVRSASTWRIERAVSSGHSPGSGDIDPDFPVAVYTGPERRSGIGRRKGTTT